MDIEDNKVNQVRGDTDNPMYHGFTCIKGRNLPEQHNGSLRLRSSMKRTADGGFQPIGSEQAMDEIAARLKQILNTTS